MKKCKNEVLMNKIGVNKLTKQSELALTVLENLPDCRRIDTKNYVRMDYDDEEYTGSPSYNRFRLPNNAFECMREGCVNTGTLYYNAAGKAAYRYSGDATEFTAGVITFYVTEDVTSATVEISSDADFANAYKYNAVLGNAAADGFKPAVVDLSKVPAETIGEGWDANESGAYISVKVNGTDMTSAGISSIGIFDSMTDFAISNVVLIGCLTNISMDVNVEAAEATCWSSGYDDTDPELELTVEGNSVTPNYNLLNPLEGKGSTTIGFDRETVEKTIQQGTGYGTVTIGDMNQDECGYLSVAFADSCNVTDAQLYRLSIPALVDVDEGHYIVINNADGSTTLYFNEALVGSPVIITYPKTVEIEEAVASVDNLGSVKVRAAETITYTDGTKVVYLYDNVLVTAFPHTITEEETSFSFTLRIQKDATGHIYRKHVIRG